MIRRTLATAVSAALVAAGAVLGLALGASPAQAASCTTSTGVNTVVDYTELGGVERGCGTGTIARAVLTSAGYTLTGGPGGPDTVCRVNGKPAAGQECWGRTQNHWYIFISRQGAAWSAATVGIDSLRVKPGDTVALVWEGTTAEVGPHVAPAQPITATPTPAPTKAPTKATTKAPSSKATKKPAVVATKKAAPPTTHTATQTASPTASASQTATPAATATAVPSEVASATVPTAAPTSDSPSATSTAAASTSTDVAPATSDSDSGGIPAWALIVVVGVLAGASSIVAWRRKQLR